MSKRPKCFLSLAFSTSSASVASYGITAMADTGPPTGLGQEDWRCRQAMAGPPVGMIATVSVNRLPVGPRRTDPGHVGGSASTGLILPGCRHAGRRQELPHPGGRDAHHPRRVAGQLQEQLAARSVRPHPHVTAPHRAGQAVVQGRARHPPPDARRSSGASSAVTIPPSTRTLYRDTDAVRTVMHPLTRALSFRSQGRSARPAAQGGQTRARSPAWRAGRR